MPRESQAIEMEMNEDGVFEPVKRRKSKKVKPSPHKAKHYDDEGGEEEIEEQYIPRPAVRVRHSQPRQQAMALHRHQAAEEFLGGFEAGMEVLGKMEKLISRWCR